MAGVAGETGGLGYFKGVMLCARPVERNVRPERESFCATVVGRAELGVDPAHKLKPRRERKRVVTAIVNHRKWLEQLNHEMETRKQRTVQEMLQEELKRMKIKQKSEKARDLIKNEQAHSIKSQVYPLFQPGDIAAASQQARSHSERIMHREPGPSQKPAQDHNIFRSVSTGKPAEFPDKRANTAGELDRTVHIRGAQTGEPASQLEATVKKQHMKSDKHNQWSKAAAAEEIEMDAQVDDLIRFMENFDAEKYAEDTETRALMASLKGRVEKLKQEPDWKDKWEERIKEKRRKREEEYRRQKEQKEADEDARSQYGNDSQMGVGGASIGSRGDAKSIQSERTQGRGISNHRSDQGNQGETGPQSTRKG